MEIRHKGIYRERFDAPFVGTLISAIACNHNCPGCHNDPIKDKQGIYVTDHMDIIKMVVEDPFSEGLILAGLEWTLQVDEMFALITAALEYNLKVILYTYRTEEEMDAMFPYLSHICKGLYIKYGEYDETKKVANYSSYGVPLATSNQYIKRIGYDD